MKPFVVFIDDAILEGATPQEEPTEELASTEKPTEELAPAMEPTEEPAPTEESTEEPAPAEEPTEELAPTKEHTVTLAVPMGTVEEPVKEPDTPHAVQEGRKGGSSM